MQHFCFPDLGKEKLCTILVFGNFHVCFNIVVRINHDNVVSRVAVGRTHANVRLQTRIRRKDGTANFGGFVYVLDLHNGISCCGFLCARLISVSFPDTTPRATTAPPMHYGYHAEGYHARTDTFKLTGYNVCRVTRPELPRSIQTSGYRRVITPPGSF